MVLEKHFALDRCGEEIFLRCSKGLTEAVIRNGRENWLENSGVSRAEI